MIKKTEKNNATSIGIIGGLGPETSCLFSLKIISEIRKLLNEQPNILLENLAVSNEVEKLIIEGGNSLKILNLLANSVKRLNKAKVDFIVIPCNTVHTFIDTLRDLSAVPIVSIIEETAKECKRKKIKKVGILASTKTIKEGLHEKELRKFDISIISPSDKEQKILCNIIRNIIHKKETIEDKKRALEIIKNLHLSGADAIILGCTDLFHLLKEDSASFNFVDTFSVFISSVVKLFLENSQIRNIPKKCEELQIRRNKK